MWYRRLRYTALLLLVVLFVLLTNAVKQSPQPVMQRDDAQVSISALYKSVHAINSIEYTQTIKTSGLGSKKSIILMHYYYRRPYHLRVETDSGNNKSVDIYRPDGMYEYFPLSSTAYYREKWKDGSPVIFQLEDKLKDIMVRGKYDLYKMEKIGDTESEVIRSVDEDDGKIYEHRIWLVSINGLKLPLKEEYMTDGDVSSTHEYEYIAINKEIDNSVFQIKSSGDLHIYNAEGIPKIVKDEKEAEEYVKFNAVIPKYTPEDFTLNEICIIPPAKTPCVLVSYLSDTDTIYVSEKNIGRNQLITSEEDTVLKVGSKKFAVRKLLNESISIRWVKDGIEFEVTGPYTLKDEIIKLTREISGVRVTIE